MRNPRRTKNPKLQKAGQRGGKATLAKYGRGYMSELGKRGGRPRSPTLAELQRQQSASKVQDQNKLKGGMATNGFLASKKHTTKLKELKRLLKQQK